LSPIGSDADAPIVGRLSEYFTPVAHDVRDMKAIPTPYRRLRLVPLAVGAILSTSCSTSRSWHCNAPTGTYSDQHFDVPETTTELSGEIVFNKTYGTERWPPFAKVGLTDRDADASDCHCDGIEATRYTNYPYLIEVALTANGKRTILGSVPYDKPVTFKLSYDRLGAVKLEVRTGVATSVWPNPKHNRLTLDCSSADVDFRSVEVK